MNLPQRRQLLLATLALAVLLCTVNGTPTRLPERKLQRKYHSGARGSSSYRPDSNYHRERELQGGNNSTQSSRSMMSMMGGNSTRSMMSMSHSNSTSTSMDSNSTSSGSRSRSSRSKKSMSMKGSKSDSSDDGTLAPSSVDVDATAVPSQGMDTPAPTMVDTPPPEVFMDLPGPQEDAPRTSDGFTHGNSARVDSQKSAGVIPATNTNPHGITRSGSGCSDNAIVYNVLIDVQVDFAGQSSNACNGKFGRVRNAVTAALNDNFASRAADWNGDVGFGPAGFDYSQTINNMGRRLGQPSEEDLIPRQHRRLADCPLEREVPCEKDICYWACLIAPTTSCGINSLTNWGTLDQDIKTKLKGLNLKCLGSGDDLVVNVIVEDPNQGEVTRSGGTSSGGAFVVVDRGGEMSSTNADSGPSNTGTIATKSLHVHSKLLINFFGGLGALPNTAEITGAETAIVLFFKHQFLANADFGPVFQEFMMENITPEYDFNKPDEFMLEYKSTVLVSESSNLDAKAAADVMAGSKFNEFIRDYARAQGGEFENTFKVHFRGVTPAKPHHNRR